MKQKNKKEDLSECYLGLLGARWCQFIRESINRWQQFQYAEQRFQDSSRAIATIPGREWSQTIPTLANMPAQGTNRAGEGTVREGQDF